MYKESMQQKIWKDNLVKTQLLNIFSSVSMSAI